MPVTCFPSSHRAARVSDINQMRTWTRTLQGPAENALTLLIGTCPEEAVRVKTMLQSSFDQSLATHHVRGSDNGFVHSVVTAYSNHHHLEIRPDDVWTAVLAQLNVYVNAHAEELRDHFVAHEGTKELVVEGGFDTVDFGEMARRMTKLMECHISDAGLRGWIVQEFSTTTDVDRTVAAISMMGTLQQYFGYTFALRCGLPSVTLLGERSDWAKLLAAVDRLASFGKEPEQWSSLLRAVFKRFVQTFDNPKSSKVVDFWQHVAHYSGNGSGPRYLSGWVTAFCFWDSKGNCLREKGLQGLTSALSPKNMLSSVTPKLTISGIAFHRIDSGDVPCGWVSVPVTLDILGRIFKTTMIAGVVAIEASKSGRELERGGTGLDTLRPRTGWWIFVQHGDVAP